MSCALFSSPPPKFWFKVSTITRPGEIPRALIASIRGPAPSGNDFAALAAKAKAAEEELRRVEAERRAALDVAAAALQAKAKGDYGAIRGLVSTPTTSGKAVLDAYAAQYGSASVTVAGVTEPVAVAVAEVARVRAALEQLGALAGSGPSLTRPTVGRLVWIPPGTYEMRNYGYLGYQDTPYTYHTFNGFYLMEHEVTQGEWQAVMGPNPSQFTACGANCPVENVSWRAWAVSSEISHRLNGVSVVRRIAKTTRVAS